MFNLVELQQQRAHKALTAKDLVDRAEKAEGGPRPMSDEEVKIFDRLTDDIASLDGQIAAVVAHNKRREASEELMKKLEGSDGRDTSPDRPANGTETRGVSGKTLIIPSGSRRTGILKAFKGPGAEERAYRSGLWARAHLFNDQRAAQKCMDIGIRVDMVGIRNAMGGGDNTGAGFLVPDELSTAIIDLREVYGVWRQQARIWPMGSDTLLIPRRSGGVTIGPIGENPASAISQSNPTFNQVQLVAKKCGGLTLMSSEIAEDAVIDLADWIAGEFGYALSQFEDRIGFTGTGISADLNVNGLTNIFTTASGLKGAVAIATVTHDLFTEVDVTDIATLMAALPAYAKVNAKFYCSSVCQELVFNRLKATAGGNTVQTLQGTTGDNYLGYPIVISQVLPSVTTAINDTAMFFFGDLSKSSSLGDRRQLRIFPSEHRYMDTDQVGIRCTERIDILNNDVGDTTTAGPIVALIGSTS